MVKKKKKKKQKLLRLKELRKIEQSQRSEIVDSAQPVQGKTQPAEHGPNPEIVKKEEILEDLPRNRSFKKDIKRVFIVIAICLIILIGIWFVFNYTNYFSFFNILLQR